MHANSLANLKPAWQKGKSPNPAGKPVAARNRLTGKFLNTLADDFEEHGKKAIEDARMADPVGYMRAIVALCPKELEVKRPLGEMTDEELASLIDAVREAVRPAERAGGGVAVPDGPQPPQGLPTLQ